MLTEDYIHQIDQAKEQYLKDLKEAQEKKATATSSTPSTGKRRLDSTAATVAAHSSAGESNKRRGTVGAVTATKVDSTLASAVVASPRSGSTDETDNGEIFDRFKELVSGGHCMEISIQHSNIQDAIGASDQDIT